MEFLKLPNFLKVHQAQIQIIAPKCLRLLSLICALTRRKIMDRKIVKYFSSSFKLVE